MPNRSVSDALRARVDARRPVALATVIDGPGVGAKLLVHPDDAGVIGSLGDEELDRVVGRDALGELAAATSGIRHYGPHGETGESTIAVFIESFAPPPRMLIFGAVDFTAALVRVAKVLGHHVTVCDAREVFATRARFPFADEVVVDWPHRLLERVDPPLGPTDAVCVLTHDHKFDIPAIRLAVQSQVGYLGAMGSRRTQAERVGLLKAEGLTDEQLARLHGPIGLDLGARTPEETAISIVAEIIAARTGRVGASLAATEGPIH